MSAIGLIGILLLLAAAFTGFWWWTRAFADLLWMFAMRPLAVGLTCMFLFGAFALLIGGLSPFDTLSPTVSLLSLLATTVGARFLANAVSQRLREGKGTALNWRSYIFDSEEAERKAHYTPPRVGPPDA